MTRKRLIALVLIMSLAAWGVIANSGPAAAAPAHPFADGSTSTSTATSNTPPASCAAPPDNADATTANRDRFIALWGPRIADKAWFSTFANAATVPSDVLAEGFHAMDEHVQAWLVACLVDNLLAATSQQATPDQLAHYQVGLDIVIFGKKQIATAKDQLQNSTAPAQGPTVPTGDLTAQHLSDTQKALANDPGVTSASIPKIDATAIATSKSTNLGTGLSSRLQDLTSSASPAPTKAKATASPSTQNATQQTINPNALLNKLGTILNQPLAALILSAINDLLQIVAQIQAILFTLPVVNVLATLFYRVCAESASQPLACSIYLPVGVPVPVDVTGDNFPDVLAELLPIIDVTSVGIDVSVQFGYSKIITNSTPLPAHIFVVYDPPIINKRIEFGYDGRASTLANSTQTLFTLHNAYAALTGDISVSMQTTSNKPGSTEALTFAIKDLIGGSAGHPATEANPMAGAVQFSPFPTKLTANAHLTHTGGQDEDIVSIQSSTPATVNAVINQDTTTTTPKSHRQFTALIDQLPTSVQVDLVHQGQKQVITYTASAAINHVNATDTATPDITHAGSFTQSIYDVLGVPASVKVTLQGAQDILYAASAKIPQVTFSTQTQVDNVLQQQITAQAHQIPMNIHVTNITTPDQQAVTYDADSVLQDVQFSMYDRSQDKTNLIASAQSIPTHIQFSQTKSKGIFDFQANAGIGVINATFTRNEGTVLHLPGDHATVHKVGNQLALELQLTGFQAAHFDGSQKTIVSMNLSPGGQSFDALADMDSPNILASVHVSQLPSTMSVTIDPVGGAATYSASSIIPDLHGSFIQRDTQTIGDFALTNIPKNVQVNWNIAGSAPQITYAADSRLGAIEAFYQKAPGDLSFHGLISNLPQYMLISGQDPITFDARTASNASPASSFIGQITFDYATDGTFESPSPATPDDHVLLDTTMGQTHAQLVYSGLSFIKASTTGQQLHIEVKNTTPRFFRAFLTTDDIVATGFIDKVPADVKIDQVGNTISYNASDPIHEIFTQAQRANGDSIQADVMDIPNSITLLFDAANSTLDWHASDVTGSISALAHLTGATLGTTRNFDAALTIAGIPRHWFATYPNGNVDFEADGAGIGSIDARVTNHVTYHTLTGDHLTAFFDQPSGDLDATLHISNLTKAAFSKLGGTNGGGFSADLNMGSHGAFAFSGDVTLNSNVKLLATGSFDNLPALIHVQSLNGRIQYTGDSNPTLNLSVSAGDAGALGVTPTPPNIHGVSVRDGSSGGQNAYKANVFLTGLPDSLDLNTPAGTYSVGNYHPSIDALNVDAVLTTIAPVPLSLELTQHIGTSQPVDFKFGPFQSSTAPDGTHSLSLNYTASRQLGSLDAEAIYGNTDDAHLFISNIPGGTEPSIHVDAAFGADQKAINIVMTQDIDHITAQYRHAGVADFAGSVDLHHVPNEIHMLIGKGSASHDNKNVEMPDFTYHASHAGLDIDAFATAAITDPLDATAAVSLMVHNIGQDVTAAIDSNTHIHVTSAPATGSFLLVAAAVIDIPNIDLHFEAGPFVNDGSLRIHLAVSQLTLGFDNFTDIGMDPGVTTGLTGDFTHFTFSEFSETTIHIEDHFKVHIDLPDPFGGVDIHLIDFGPNDFNLHNLIDHFRITSNQLGEIFSITAFEAILASCDVTINARPKPGFDSGGPTISLPGPPPSDGHSPAAWLITPNINLFGITLPDFAADVVAFFESPYGNEITPGFSCHFGP